MRISQEIDYVRQHCPSLLNPRPIDSNKGDFGNCALLAGGKGMVGAALLAGRSALLLGAGRVFIGFTQAEQPLEVDIEFPELMLHTATRLLSKSDMDVWVVGCGMGQNEFALDCLRQLLAQPNRTPCVLDADALNLLARNPDLKINVRSRRACTVLTPHPGEASRLLGVSIAEIQNERLASACQIAQDFQSWVILKGHQTVIANPEGVTWVNTSGNPSLASAGTGDVLAGMVGSLIAQGLPWKEALMAGVWLHGAAADQLVEQGVGPIGIRAMELGLAARQLRGHLMRQFRQ